MGGAGAGAAPDGTASPSSTRIAIGALTAMFGEPSATRILPSTPSSTASTSMVALSVSISAITSPALMVSPSFFSQRASVPSVMVGLSAGIRILVAMANAPFSDDLLDRVHHPIGLRQGQLLQIGGIGQRHIDSVDPHRRRIQPVEGVLDHLHHHFRADTGERPPFFHRHQPVGFLDAF